MHGFGNGRGGRFGNGHGVNGPNGGRGPRNHGGHNCFERERYIVNHEEEHGPRYEDPTKSIKHTLPEFHGNYDPAACLEWLSQVERIIDVHRYTEEDKVKLAVAEFRGYAHVWWTDFVRRRQALVVEEVGHWNTLKTLMETAFVPKSYFVKLRRELQDLKQGTKKVMEYYQKLLILMNKVGKVESESESDIQDRFVHGLNTHFNHRVQLEALRGITLVELLLFAATIEEQAQELGPNRNKVVTNQARVVAGSSKWGPQVKRIEPTSSPKTLEKAPLKALPCPQVAKNIITPTGSRQQCFKCKGYGHFARDCANQRFMIIYQNGDMHSGDEGEEEDLPKKGNWSYESQPNILDSDDESNGGKQTLVVLRSISTQA